MSGLVIYTDGACSGNPGPGGWGWAVAPTGEPHGSGGEAHTTNQRMEIYAVLDALRTHAHLADDHGAPMPIEIVSDSTYVVNCFKDRWWVKWQRNGWVNSQKQAGGERRSVGAADRARTGGRREFPLGQGPQR